MTTADVVAGRMRLLGERIEEDGSLSVVVAEGRSGGVSAAGSGT